MWKLNKKIFHHPFFVTLLLICILCFFTWANLSSDLEQITGNRTKIVFAKCITSDGDLDLTTADYSLVGFDTYRGEFFEIVSGPRYCTHPVITPDGESVLFSDLDKNIVYIVPWCGTSPRVLNSGYVLCVQRDTVSGIDWVYISDYAYGTCIYRYDLADMSRRELVWNKTQVSIRFNVSANGLFGGGEFPWSDAGEVSLPNNEFIQFGSGCNTNIAPDNSYRLFHMDGNHRSIWMYDSGGTNKREIQLDNIPGIEEHPSWIPRWSNDVRFFTLTAPCATSQTKTYKEDIYFGCFNETYDSVKQWIQITSTADTFENYAYSWIGRERYVKLNNYIIKLSRDCTNPDQLSQEVIISSENGSLQNFSLSTQDDWLQTETSNRNGTIVIKNIIDTTKVKMPGSYSTIVTIHCQGFADEFYRVDYNIGIDTRPATLSIGPKRSHIPQFDSVDYKGICYDQYKSPLTVPLHWSLSGGGSIDSTGRFRSNGDTGIFILRACVLSDMAITDSTTISIYEKPHIIKPNKQSVEHAGDSLVVQWTSHVSSFRNLMIYLSVNKGKNWKLLNPTHAIYPEFDTVGSFSWLLPQSFCDDRKSVALNSCLVKITDYSNQIQVITDEPFKIICPGDNTILPKNIYMVKKVLRYPFLRTLTSDEWIKISLFTLSGKIIDHYDGLAGNTEIALVPKGIYIVRIATLTQIFNKKYIVW
jgi:hypothetical protein